MEKKCLERGEELWNDGAVSCVVMIQGYWSEGIQYDRGDVVRIGSPDSFWVCLSPSMNAWPKEGVQWTRLQNSHPVRQSGLL
jgi:hypothetical protein